MGHKIPEVGDLLLTWLGHELKPRRGQKDFSVTLGVIGKVERYTFHTNPEDDNYHVGFVYPLRLHPCLAFGGLTVHIINRPISNYMGVSHCPSRRYSPNTRKVVMGREEIMEKLRSSESLAPHADWIRDYNPKFLPEELFAFERNNPDKKWIW